MILTILRKEILVIFQNSTIGDANQTIGDYKEESVGKIWARLKELHGVWEPNEANEIVTRWELGLFAEGKYVTERDNLNHWVENLDQERVQIAQ